MLFDQMIALVVVLMIATCRKGSAERSTFGPEIGPRTSNHPSSSGTGGSSPPHESSGLLGDIVAHAMRRPAPAAHPTQSTQAHPAHPSQSTMGHTAHSGQISQPRPAQLTPRPDRASPFAKALSAQLLAGHTAHSGQATHVQPVQLIPRPDHAGHSAHAHPAQLMHPSHIKQVHTGQAHPVDTGGSSHSQHVPFGRMAQLGGSVRPAPLPEKKPRGRPTGYSPGKRPPVSERKKPLGRPFGSKNRTPEDIAKRPLGRPVGSQNQLGRKKTDPWWKKVGGRPNVPQGSHPQYEIKKANRARLKETKQQALQGQPHDQHPPAHQPHRGGGPGSPGAGGQAVSKRRVD